MGVGGREGRREGRREGVRRELLQRVGGAEHREPLGDPGKQGAVGAALAGSTACSGRVTLAIV